MHTQSMELRDEKQKMFLSRRSRSVTSLPYCFSIHLCSQLSRIFWRKSRQLVQFTFLFLYSGIRVVVMHFIEKAEAVCLVYFSFSSFAISLLSCVLWKKSRRLVHFPFLFLRLFIPITFHHLITKSNKLVYFRYKINIKRRREGKQ